MITPEFVAKISECQEAIRWSPLYQQIQLVDYDVLMETLVNQICFWVANEPDYTKEVARWMVWFFMDDLKQCAERRLDNPIMELKPSYQSETAYRNCYQQGCTLIIAEWQSRFDHECRL